LLGRNTREILGGPSKRGLFVLGQLFDQETRRREALATAVISAESIRCVQCGVCSYNCPMGVDVRRLVREGWPISHSHCLTCGQCVARCPRGVLSLEPSPIFD
jgi:heterodisulfide reductase subunit C